jgi:predicted DNA-binding transcriptional regulator AlpA
MTQAVQLVKDPGGEVEQPGRSTEAQEVLAVAPSVAARMLGISRAQLWKLHSAGKLPSPIYLSRKAPRWRMEELRAWVRAGCPERTTWQKMKGARAA